MNYNEFAEKIKQKYPGSYDDMDNKTLAKKMVDKFPQYSDVTFDEVQPSQQDRPISNLFQQAINVQPITMAAKAIPAVTGVLDKTFNTVSIPVPRGVQRGAQKLFGGYRGLGVGAVNLMRGVSPSVLLPGGIYSQRNMSQIARNAPMAIERASAATQPEFIPSDTAEELAGSLGEAIPVTAMAGMSPAAGGIAFAAQQAQRGKVGALPLALAASPAVKPIASLGKYAGKRLFSGVFGPEVKAVEMRYSNPAELKEALPYQELGKRLAKNLNKIKEDAINESDATWESLITLKSEPRSKIVSLIKDIQSKYRVTGGGPTGAADRAVNDELSRLVNDIQNIKQKGVSTKLEQFLDQKQLKQLIQSADRNANWDNPYPNPREVAYRQYRMKLDEWLKGENPEYAAKMAPIQNKLRLVDELASSFSIKKGSKGDLVPSDTTASRFPLVLDEKRDPTRNLLSKLKEITGKDYLKAAQNYKYAKQFEPGSTRMAGSRRVNLGGAVGAGIGGLFGGWGGSALGALGGTTTGAYLDTQGGVAAGKLVDIARKAGSILKKIPTDQVSGSVRSIVPAISVSKELDEETAANLLNEVGGDIEMARELAKQRGYTWEGM